MEKAEQCRAGFGKRAEEVSVKELTRDRRQNIACKGGTDKRSLGHNDTLCQSKCSMPSHDEPPKALKIAVLPHQNNLSFMGEILARMRATHEVRVVDCKDQQGIAEALMSADVCWIEWATDFAVRVTALPRRCKTILRLHSFEAFCSSAAQIHWEKVDDLVLVSPYIRDVLKDRVPDIERKVRTHVVPNCIDLNKFHLQDRPRGKRIAFVGALRPAKNIPFLLQCFREIHAADPEYTLHVAGDLFGRELHCNELCYYVEHMEKALGIQGCVRFYGHVEDICTWLDDKDFILSASIREGHPVNVVEGMAKGLKPVIHNYPGARGTYRDEWIFDTAQACRDIVLAPDFDRQEYRAFAAQHWSTEKVLPQIDALLQGSSGVTVSKDSHRVTTPAEKTPLGAMGCASASTPKVSIVTACYNAEEFLVECLDSILAQTMSDWELFLIDDASTDGTRRIIEEYAGRDARIKPYCFDDNRGPYVRRNFAIERANAPFIVIHDADDIMCPEKLQRLHAAISEDERFGVVGSFYRMFLDEFQGIEHCEDVTLAMSHEEILEAYRNLGTCDFCPHGVAIIRKRLFEEIGPYDENPFGSDSFWLAKVVEYACRSDEIALKNVPEFLMLRRMHARSQTASLPTFDPRSRRAKFREYRFSRLSAMIRKLDSDPAVDVKAELRRSVCNDFVEKNGHLFAEWEGAPLTGPIVQKFVRTIWSQFARGQFVRCIVTCGTVERLVEGIANNVRDYDLVRGLAYFALGYRQESRECLLRESHAHGTRLAADFLREYVDHDSGQWSQDQRFHIVRNTIIPADRKGGAESVRCLPAPGAQRPVGLSIVVPFADDAAVWAELTASFNAQEEKDFEVIVLTQSATEHGLDSLSCGRDLPLTVLSFGQDVRCWERRNAAADRAQGRYIAFLGEHILPDRDFVKCVLRHFRGDHIGGLRGRIVCEGDSPRPGRFDLGPDVLRAACDIDELCVFDRAAFSRLGGFPPAVFAQGAIQLSYRMYADESESRRPILYCPDVVARYKGPAEPGAALVDRFILERRLALSQFEQSGHVSVDEMTRVWTFLRFVEGLYQFGEQTQEECYRQALDKTLFFHEQDPRLASEWAERALQCQPDSVKARYALGRSLSTLGRPRQACVYLDETLDPLEALLALERVDRTGGEFTNYEDIANCYVSACALLAACYMKTGQFDRVAATYTRLLENRHIHLETLQRRSMERVRDRVAHLLRKGPRFTSSHPVGNERLSSWMNRASTSMSEETVPAAGCPAAECGGEGEPNRGQAQILADLERKYQSIPQGTSARHAAAVRLSEMSRRAGLKKRSRAFKKEAVPIRDGFGMETVAPGLDQGASVPGPGDAGGAPSTPSRTDANHERQPLVTVITVCRNGAEYLSECLDGILSQTLPDWELFLLDDGSTDGTRRIMEEYAGRDARIKLHLFDDNKGP